MEVKLSIVLGAILAVLCVGASALSIPQEQDVHDNELQLSNDGELIDDKRATWLDTRELEEEFKELVFLAIRELATEGRLDKSIVTGEQTKAKRGHGQKWQGFCFRRTRSGRFLPYICWKGGDRK